MSGLTLAVGNMGKGEGYRMTRDQTNPRRKRVTISICGGVLISLLVASLAGASSRVFRTNYTDQVNGAPQTRSDESGWERVDAGPFSILAPPGWKFHQLAGVDSFVGEFVGDDITLRFDFGAHSNPLKEEKKPAYVVLHKSIAGRKARIVSSRTPGQGITGVYFRNVGDSNALTLFAHDLTPTQQELVLKVFETLRFGGRVTRYALPPPPPLEKTASDAGVSHPLCCLQRVTQSGNLEPSTWKEKPVARTTSHSDLDPTGDRQVECAPRLRRR